ncbi:MAG: hypothetical protein ACMXYB_04905 [Candidatus Woesearchaeota archaeon]
MKELKIYYIAQKKALLGFKWPLLFIFTLIGTSFIIIALFNDQIDRNDNFYLDALRINNEFLMEQKELRLLLLKLNSDSQNEIMSEIGNNFFETTSSQIKTRYTEKMNSKVESHFRRWFGRGVEHYVEDSIVYVPKKISRPSITITKNISSPLFHYKEPFLEQVQMLQSFQAIIESTQSQINECYDGSYNQNICLKKIEFEISNQNEFIICEQTTQRTIPALECFFNKAPFTTHTFNIPRLVRQESRTNGINIPPKVLFRENNKLKINTSVLFTNVEQMESYYVFLIPNSNYNIESAVNSFENRIIQQTQNRNRLSLITNELLLETFEDEIILKNVDKQIYRIEIERIPVIYIKTLKNYLQFDIDELPEVAISEIIEFTNHPLSEPHSIFITQNRFNQDSSSMFERGTIIQTPSQLTQNPHER